MMTDVSLRNCMHCDNLVGVILLFSVLPLLIETAIEVQHIRLRQERGAGNNCITVYDEYTNGWRKCCDRKHALM